MVLDTGVILPFSFYEWPTSKLKIIEFLLDQFDIYSPGKVMQEMERPKERLQDQWDEISLTWERVKKRFIRKDPPSSCLNRVIEKSGKQNLSEIPAEYYVLALCLFLSHHQNSLVFLATHERNAFGLFNELSRKEQVGYVFSPFDILTFSHLYLGVAFDDAQDVWRSLIDFPNTSINLPLRPVKYGNSLEICAQGCQTSKCI